MSLISLWSNATKFISAIGIWKFKSQKYANIEKSKFLLAPNFRILDLLLAPSTFHTTRKQAILPILWGRGQCRLLRSPASDLHRESAAVPRRCRAQPPCGRCAHRGQGGRLGASRLPRESLPESSTKTWRKQKKKCGKKDDTQSKKACEDIYFGPFFFNCFWANFQIVNGTFKFTDSSLVFDAMFGVPNVSLGTGMRRRCIRLG